MSFREIIWPTRWKVTLALLIGALSVFIIYLLNPYYQDAIFSLDIHLRVLSVFLSFAIVTLIYYPLSCGVVFLYRSFLGRPAKPAKKAEKAEKGKKPVQKAKPEKGRPSRRDLIMAILLILIFNPLTFSLMYSAGWYVNMNVLSYPCGVQVLGFSDVSPAELVGMSPGEVITTVDNQTITTTDSLTRALIGKKPGDFVNVITKANEYDIQLALNPEINRTVMGVITQNAYCRRW
jgi:membrane-associated protease RseP (regulator of RpoE activity)